MAAHKVHERIEEWQRIVFAQAFKTAHKCIRIDISTDECNGYVADRIVHDAVQRIPGAVAAHLTI